MEIVLHYLNYVMDKNRLKSDCLLFLVVLTIYIYMQGL